MNATGSEGVVLGLDIGSTATKVVAADRHGTVLYRAERRNEMRNDEPGEAVQDAAAVRASAVAAVAEVATWASETGCTVEAVSFSTAMHNLLGLDADGEPVTPAFHLSDSRCAEMAAKLREDGDSAEALHRSTGTPVHTQSVMVKLAWVTAQRADLGARVNRWCGLKDYVLAAFTGRFVTDHSLASGTGLLNMTTLRWHGPALETAGISADGLPELSAPTETLPLSESAARTTGLKAGLPVVLGAGDGPLGNLGVGAINTGVAGLSLGTSGAFRVVREEPGVDARCRTFCYALADGLWVTGGAVSNGAVVGDWSAEVFGTDLVELLDEAQRVPVGARGLTALPYLMGERAP